MRCSENNIPQKFKFKFKLYLICIKLLLFFQLTFFKTWIDPSSLLSTLNTDPWAPFPSRSSNCRGIKRITIITILDKLFNLFCLFVFCLSVWGILFYLFFWGKCFGHYSSLELHEVWFASGVDSRTNLTVLELVFRHCQRYFCYQLLVLFSTSTIHFSATHIRILTYTWHLPKQSQMSIFFFKN